MPGSGRVKDTREAQNQFEMQEENVKKKKTTLKNTKDKMILLLLRMEPY